MYSSLRRRAYAPSVLLVLAITAGCSGSPGSSDPQVPFQTSPQSAASTRLPAFQAVSGLPLSGAALDTDVVSPDATHATRADQVSANGGTFKLPKFGGFTGNMQYGPNGASAGTTVVFEVATTNVFGAPKCLSGKAVVYVGYGSASFIIFSNGNQSMQISSPALNDGKNYDVYGFSGSMQFITPIRAGKPQNHILTFQSPIDQTEVIENSYTYVLDICVQ